MAVTRNTPTLGLRGTWSLVSPWSASASTLFTCTALRTFTEMIQEGIDIYTTYYVANGLDSAKYNEDLAAGAVMVILYSESAGTVITVPDTYIDSYPGIGMANYGNIILSASIGPIALSTNTDFLVEQVQNIISDTIGIAPTVYIDLLESGTALTSEQAAAIEAARQAAITNRTSTYAQLLTANSTIATQAATITSLLAALQAEQSGS